MVDCFDAAKRSEIMSGVRGVNTGVEIAVRRLLHSFGYRFRINVRNLPGKPDIVLPKYRCVIFVNGCFWHGHKRCKRATIPKTNSEFWSRKIGGNIERDVRNIKRLRGLGWKVLVIWQCQTSRPANLVQRIEAFLTRSDA